jgi:hypothetical protein
MVQVGDIIRNSMVLFRGLERSMVGVGVGTNAIVDAKGILCSSSGGGTISNSSVIQVIQTNWEGVGESQIFFFLLEGGWLLVALYIIVSP